MCKVVPTLYALNMCGLRGVLGIQDLLTDPNPESPANNEAAQLFKKKPAEYKKKLREQAAKFVPDS